MTATMSGWMDQARCRGRWYWDALPVAAQKAYCSACPVKFECLQFALDHERTQPALCEENPVYGGLTGAERRRMLERKRHRTQDAAFPAAVKDQVYQVGVA